MATPSLAMIPSGYKAQKVYSVLPTNGDGDFTFARSGTATRVNQSGLIETVGNNVPRLDYSNGGCPSLLLEPERTNLITYSEDFSQSDWNKLNNVTVSSEKVISPDGTLNASQLVFDGTANGRIEKAIAGLTQGADYSVSIYARVSSGTQVVNFGSVADFPYTLTTEWQRLTSTEAENDTTAYPRLKCEDAATIEIWGFQLEQGSYATSYIPNYGTALGVTRSAESANGSGDASTFNSEQGVLYFEGSSIANDGTFKRISIGTSDDLFANSIQLRYNDVDNSITYQFRVGNVYQADLTITANTTNVNKIACVWKINRFEIWVNGLKQAEDTSGSVPSSNTFNSLFFGKSSNALVEPFKGNIKDLRVYNTALTDLELQTLTTI
jgi:hypothetical protein